MKNTRILLLLSLITLLTNCKEDYWEKVEKERKIFEKNISIEQKEIINKFFKGILENKDDSLAINGGFYCLWKDRNHDIYPHLALNHRLKSQGYNITNHKDSLDYIVISESISHKVGTYSNGGDATKLEVVISLINFKTKSCSTLKSVMGSEPPSSISRKNGSNIGSIGTYFNDDDIFIFLTSEVIKK